MKLFNIEVKDGTQHDNGLLKYLVELPDGSYQCHIGKSAELRTLRQNNYWWACMDIMSKHFGYKPKAMSNEIKEHFGWYETHVNKATGEIKKDFTSSADWNKKEFAENTEELIQFAAENGVIIPTPDEYYAGIETQILKQERKLK